VGIAGRVDRAVPDELLHRIEQLDHERLRAPVEVVDE
jgi:hypothetical protein